MKTLEELAEQYLDQDKVACDAINHAAEDLVRAAFLAGYKAAQQWISVKDRLPEMDKWVLIDGPEVCKRIKPPSSNWKEQYAWETNHESFYSANDVTHWMPLPKPSEEK